MSADSILKEMMAQVSGMAEDKRKAGAGLTPVAAERPRTGSLPEAGQMVGPGKRAEWSAGYGIPNKEGGVILDDPDLVRGRIAEIKVILADLQRSADRLMELWAVPQAEALRAEMGQQPVVPQEAPVPQPVEQAPNAEHSTDPVPVEEQPDDEREAKFDEMFAAKQAAAQAQAFTPETAPVAGWRCPTDADHRAISKTSPKGRVYWKCTECHEFEK